MSWKIGSSEFSEVFDSPAVIGACRLFRSIENAYACHFSGRERADNRSKHGTIFSYSFKPMAIENSTPIPIIFSAATRPQVALPIIQRVSIFMVNCKHVPPCDSSMHGNAESLIPSQSETRCRSKLFAATLKTGVPIELIKSIDIPSIDKRKLTLCKNYIGNAWANRNYSFSRRMRSHRFAPLKQFASRALQALSATMPPLYAPQGVHA